MWTSQCCRGCHPFPPREERYTPPRRSSKEVHVLEFIASHQDSNGRPYVGWLDLKALHMVNEQLKEACCNAMQQRSKKTTLRGLHRITDFVLSQFIPMNFTTMCFGDFELNVFENKGKGAAFAYLEVVAGMPPGTAECVGLDGDWVVVPLMLQGLINVGVLQNHRLGRCKEPLGGLTPEFCRRVMWRQLWGQPRVLVEQEERLLRCLLTLFDDPVEYEVDDLGRRWVKIALIVDHDLPIEGVVEQTQVNGTPNTPRDRKWMITTVRRDIRGLNPSVKLDKRYHLQLAPMELFMAGVHGFPKTWLRWKLATSEEWTLAECVVDANGQEELGGTTATFGSNPEYTMVGLLFGAAAMSPEGRFPAQVKEDAHTARGDDRLVTRETSGACVARFSWQQSEQQAEELAEAKGRPVVYADAAAEARQHDLDATHELLQRLVLPFVMYELRSNPAAPTLGVKVSHGTGVQFTFYKTDGEVTGSCSIRPCLLHWRTALSNLANNLSTADCDVKGAVDKALGIFMV